jgi:hypothetical protein
MFYRNRTSINARQRISDSFYAGCIIQLCDIFKPLWHPLPISEIDKQLEYTKHLFFPTHQHALLPV